jgi:hypothetical protein
MTHTVRDLENMALALLCGKMEASLLVPAPLAADTLPALLPEYLLGLLSFPPLSTWNAVLQCF